MIVENAFLGTFSIFPDYTGKNYTEFLLIMLTIFSQKSEAAIFSQS